MVTPKEAQVTLNAAAVLSHSVIPANAGIQKSWRGQLSESAPGSLP